MKYLVSAAVASAMLALIPATQAAAQSSDGQSANQDQSSSKNPSASSPSVDQLQEVVVTGTLIRGIAPVGTNLVTMSAPDIVATGAETANQVLASIPEVTSNFNQVRMLPAVGSGLTTLTPSLRNVGTLPGVSASSGAVTTLVLVDGHRVVDAGVLSTAPDPDVIPPAVLERVEVMPDGGSSIYGSDAVGGVINFITRKRFSGFSVVAHEGFGSNYNTSDVNTTAGSDWGSGSAYISYDFQHNTQILAKDRSFVHQVTANLGGCGAGTVFVGATPYALPGLTPNTITNCDTWANSTFYPEQSRHSVFGSLTQVLTDRVTFDMTAFFTERESTSQLDPADQQNREASSVICSPAVGAAGCAAVGGVVFPGYVPVAGDAGVQRVEYNFGSLINPLESNRLDEFQVTPTLSVDLGAGWQLRLLGAYGQSTVDASQVLLGSGLAGAIAAGTLNPYDARATSLSVMPTLESDFIGKGTQGLGTARATVDGHLFSLPGGEVRLAVGAEHRHESLDNVVFGNFAPGTENTAHPISSGRNVNSAFAETVIPIVGSGNMMSAVKSLSFSASARYDRYSDFGNTFDPKFGVTYKPVQWVNIRGNWGKSFVAPSLADTHAPDTRAFNLPAFLLAAPGNPVANLAQQLVVLVGGNPNLGPERAHTWSIGGDISPPIVEGLTASVTYWNIRLTDQIAVPPISQVIYSPSYSAFSSLNPTLAQVLQKIGSAPWVGTILPQDLYANPAGVYSLLDFRRHNLGDVDQDGIDFDIRYRKPTSFGSVSASVAGTRLLNWKIAAVAGGSLTDILYTPGASNFSVVTTVGATAGGLTGTVYWYHTQGFDINPALVSPNFPAQTRVGGFDTFNLFVSYDFNGKNLLKDLSLTLNVDNLFDRNPPFYNGTGFSTLPGYAPNTGTLGRVVTIGLSKQF